MDDTNTNRQAEQPYPAELKVILQRAIAGDRTILPQLKLALDQYPELSRQFGDLAKAARETLLSLLDGGCLLAREAVTRDTEHLRERLLAEAGTDLEKLLVERIVLSQLAVSLAEVEVAGHLKAGSSRLTVVAAEQRLGRCQARLITAMKALATLRKLCRRPLSPLDFAQRVPAERPADVCRRGTLAAGVPVEN